MAEQKKKREFRSDSSRGKINALYEALTSKKTLKDVIKEMGFEKEFKISKNHLKFLVNNLEFLPEEEAKGLLTDKDRVRIKKSLGKEFLELVTLEEAQSIVNRAVSELRTLKGEEVKKPKRKSKKKKGK